LINATNKTNDADWKNKRSYQLDFIKFFLTILVFLCHAGSNFSNENTRFFNEWFCSYGQMGYVATQGFFIVSGFLMINSFEKTARKPKRRYRQKFSVICFE